MLRCRFHFDTKPQSENYTTEYHSQTVMVSEDDYRRDTFPPLSLWQVLRIAPHLLALRTYPYPCASLRLENLSLA